MDDEPRPPAPAVKVRQDLVLTRQEQQGVVSFVVKDPVTRRFFRFKEPEAFLIRRLCGTHSLEAIRKEFEETFEAELPADALAAFVTRLAELGLLDDETGTTRHATRRRSVLYLRFRAFDPDRVLTWLLPRTGLFFTTWFLRLSFVLILLATGLTLTNSAEIALEAPVLLSGSSLLLIWVAAFAVSCTHEFAHGLACKRYGGEVREMGFMLLFFMPAFYCNVSDAWLFSRRQKLIVLFAGAYWQIVLWALATLAWRLTPAGTFPHLVALIVTGICGVRTFFNLNPLIKLDGYYLLSDYLELPNLRQRAFAYLRGAIGRLRGAATATTGEVSARERRIYLAYGLLAGAYSLGLLGFVAVTVAWFLAARFQGMGVVLFTGLLMILLNNPMKRLLRRVKGPAAGPAEPTSSTRRTFRRPVQLAALAGAFLLLWFGRLELRVAGEFQVEPSHNADIRAGVAGIIDQVLVDEGDLVEPGQAIARLRDRDLRLDLERVEADLANRRAALNLLRAGPRQEEINLANAEVRAAETARRVSFDRYQEARRMHAERAARATASVETITQQVDYARTVFDRHRDLFDRQLIARATLDEVSQGLSMRERELEEARALLQAIAADDLAEMRGLLAAADESVTRSKRRLDVLLAGSRPEEIAAVTAEIDELLARKVYIEEQVGLTTLVSPIAGVVTTPDMEELPGRHVDRGDLVAEVYDLTSVVAELSVPETLIADVRVGDRVVLKARAYAHDVFEGRVTAIAPAIGGDALPGPAAARIIRVTTRIDNSGGRLKPGMTGMGKIDCGERSIVDLVTRRLVRYLRVEFWSYW